MTILFLNILRESEVFRSTEGLEVSLTPSARRLKSLAFPSLRTKTMGVFPLYRFRYPRSAPRLLILPRWAEYVIRSECRKSIIHCSWLISTLRCSAGETVAWPGHRVLGDRRKPSQGTRGTNVNKNIIPHASYKVFTARLVPMSGRRTRNSRLALDSRHPNRCLLF